MGIGSSVLAVVVMYMFFSMVPVSSAASNVTSMNPDMAMVLKAFTVSFLRKNLVMAVSLSFFMFWMRRWYSMVMAR